ncbi:MAG: ABC transporter permease subunit [Clostridia bacterium]|nr:ABC transporter permease subunit [Clostridia bacterium]
MKALIKKELSGYFASPLGYIYIAAMVLVASYQFFMNVVLYGKTDMSAVYDIIFLLSFVLVPLLTMRTISEERRHKTDQLLYTAPVTTTSVIIGKFLGTLLLYASAVGVVFLYQIFLSFFTGTDWGMMLSGFVGIMCVGGTLISVGMLVSSFTENQFSALIISYIVALFFMLADSYVTAADSSPILQGIVQFASLHTHFQSFYKGFISLGDVFYFASMMFLFLFLTGRSLDKKRWA